MRSKCTIYTRTHPLGMYHRATTTYKVCPHTYSMPYVQCTYSHLQYMYGTHAYFDGDCPSAWAISAINYKISTITKSE